MSEPLYVDPEELAAQSRPYEQASREWVRVQKWVGEIRDRYNGAWGDDDLGNKFGPDFLEGMDSVGGRAEGVAGTLTYYAEGLVENGRLFGDARDDADQTTHMLLTETETIGNYEAPAGAQYAGVKSVEGTVTAPLRRQAVRAVTPAERLEQQQQQPDEPLLERGQVMHARMALAPALVDGRRLTQYADQKEGLLAQPATQGELLQPTYSRSVVTAQIIEPAEPLRDGEPHLALMEAHVSVTVSVQAPVLKEDHVRGDLAPGEVRPAEARLPLAFQPHEGLPHGVLLPLEPAQQVWRTAVPGESLELPAEPVVKTE